MDSVGFFIVFVIEVCNTCNGIIGSERKTLHCGKSGRAYDLSHQVLQPLESSSERTKLRDLWG